MLGLERDMLECDQCGSVYSIIAESDEMNPIFCPFCGDDRWVDDDDADWKKNELYGDDKYWLDPEEEDVDV